MSTVYAVTGVLVGLGFDSPRRLAFPHVSAVIVPLWTVRGTNVDHLCVAHCELQHHPDLIAGTAHAACGFACCVFRSGSAYVDPFSWAGRGLPGLGGRGINPNGDRSTAAWRRRSLPRRAVGGCPGPGDGLGEVPAAADERPTPRRDTLDLDLE
jgi:hypothetical protein